MSYGKLSFTLPAVSLAAVSLMAAAARAQQYELVDTTFTATAENTVESRMNLEPNDDAPDDWTTPVDYAGGSVHVRMEVIDKPSDVPTRMNVCFEGAPGETLSCLPYISDLYTEPGIYEEEYDFEGFWQYDVRDWTEPTSRIAIVLKDENEDFATGNPDFYPTQVRMTLTLVAEGSTYDPDYEEPEPEPEPDAGMAGEGGDGGTNASGGEGGMSATGGAGGTNASGGEGGMSASGGAGGTSTSGGAGGMNASSGAGGSSGSAAPGSGGMNAAPRGPDTQGQGDTNRPGWTVPAGDDGCTIARAGQRSRSGVGFALLACVSALALRKRRASGFRAGASKPSC